MKNQTNKFLIVLAFLGGMAGFLLVFKLFMLPYISPNDELAPGMVLILSVFAGGFLALATKIVLKYTGRKAA